MMETYRLTKRFDSFDLGDCLFSEEKLRFKEVCRAIRKGTWKMSLPGMTSELQYYQSLCITKINAFFIDLLQNVNEEHFLKRKNRIAGEKQEKPKRSYASGDSNEKKRDKSSLRNKKKNPQEERESFERGSKMSRTPNRKASEESDSRERESQGKAAKREKEKRGRNPKEQGNSFSKDSNRKIKASIDREDDEESDVSSEEEAERNKREESQEQSDEESRGSWERKSSNQKKKSNKKPRNKESEEDSMVDKRKSPPTKDKRSKSQLKGKKREDQKKAESSEEEEREKNSSEDEKDLRESDKKSTKRGKSQIKGKKMDDQKVQGSEGEVKEKNSSEDEKGLRESDKKSTQRSQRKGREDSSRKDEGKKRDVSGGPVKRAVTDRKKTNKDYEKTSTILINLESSPAPSSKNSESQRKNEPDKDDSATFSSSRKQEKQEKPKKESSGKKNQWSTENSICVSEIVPQEEYRPKEEELGRFGNEEGVIQGDGIPRKREKENQSGKNMHQQNDGQNKKEENAKNPKENHLVSRKNDSERSLSLSLSQSNSASDLDAEKNKKTSQEPIPEKEKAERGNLKKKDPMHFHFPKTEEKNEVAPAKKRFSTAAERRSSLLESIALIENFNALDESSPERTNYKNPKEKEGISEIKNKETPGGDQKKTGEPDASPKFGIVETEREKNEEAGKEAEINKKKSQKKQGWSPGFKKSLNKDIKPENPEFDPSKNKETPTPIIEEKKEKEEPSPEPKRNQFGSYNPAGTPDIGPHVPGENEAKKSKGGSPGSDERKDFNEEFDGFVTSYDKEDLIIGSEEIDTSTEKLRLEYDKSGVTDDELKNICLRLCEFTELKSLYLKINENKVSNVGLVYIGKFLSLIQLKSLEIYLRSNSYDDKGAGFLINQICKQESLENLKISFWKSNVTDETCNRLANSLKKIQTLKSFAVWFNYSAVTEYARIKLRHCLSTMPNIKGGMKNIDNQMAFVKQKTTHLENQH